MVVASQGATLEEEANVRLSLRSVDRVPLRTPQSNPAASPLSSKLSPLSRSNMRANAPDTL